jgi:hypothetical protein
LQDGSRFFFASKLGVDRFVYVTAEAAALLQRDRSAHQEIRTPYPTPISKVPLVDDIDAPFHGLKGSCCRIFLGGSPAAPGYVFNLQALVFVEPEDANTGSRITRALSLFSKRYLGVAT